MAIASDEVTRKLKVYQGSLDGRNRFCVAASSWKAAHAAITKVTPNVSLHYLQTMWSVTGNAEQITAAMSEPGALFGQLGRHPHGAYRPLRSSDDIHNLTAEWLARG